MVNIYVEGDVEKTISLDYIPHAGMILTLDYDEYDPERSRRMDDDCYHHRTGDFEVTRVRGDEGGSVYVTVRRA